MILKANNYKIPSVFEQVTLLDLLELSGNTTLTAKAIKLSQPTVSRQTQRIIKELEISINKKTAKYQLKYKSNLCVEYLRRAAQVHRFEKNRIRLGYSIWQQAAVNKIEQFTPITYGFKHPNLWHELVENYIIDAAIISGLDLSLVLNEPLLNSQSDHLEWKNCLLIRIANSLLGLLVPPKTRGSPDKWARIAVPAQRHAPVLTAIVRQENYQCLYAKHTCHSTEQWAEWLNEGCYPLIATEICAKGLLPLLDSWQWQKWPHEIKEQHWLLVHRENWQNGIVMKQLWEELKTAISTFYSSGE